MKTLKSFGLATHLLLSACAAVTAFGCSTESGMEAEQEVGTLSLPLTATSSSGQKYRLVNGAFQLTGPVSRLLQGDPETSSTLITQQLPAGAYSIALQSGWQIQAESGGGALTSVTATLVSPVSQSFNIIDGAQTGVVYLFQVDGEVIQFGNGQLNVTFMVEEAPSCSAPLTSCGNSCVDLATSASNCGACGNVCSAGTSCVAGACIPSNPTCTAPQVLCGASCVDVLTDETNCGSCGSICSVSSTCISGTCVPSSGLHEVRMDPGGLDPSPWGPLLWSAGGSGDDCPSCQTGTVPYTVFNGSDAMCITGVTTVGDVGEGSWLSLLNPTQGPVLPAGFASMDLSLAGDAPGGLSLIAIDASQRQAVYDIGILQGAKNITIQPGDFTCPAWLPASQCLSDVSQAMGLVLYAPGGFISAPFMVCETRLSVRY